MAGKSITVLLLHATFQEKELWEDLLKAMVCQVPTLSASFFLDLLLTWYGWAIALLTSPNPFLHIQLNPHTIVTTSMRSL